MVKNIAFIYLAYRKSGWNIFKTFHAFIRKSDNFFPLDFIDILLINRVILHGLNDSTKDQTWNRFAEKITKINH